MSVTSTITSKGQTTVPDEVRNALGISGPNQRIIYQIEGKSVRMRAVNTSIMSVAGALADGTPALSRKEERAIYRKALAKRYLIKE